MEELIRLGLANFLLSKAVESKKNLEYLYTTRFKSYCDNYKNTIKIETNNGAKSNVPSAIYFNEYTMGKAWWINLKSLDSASGTLVGLGLLGTFFGLSLGIRNFDSSDTENIQQSIQHLLDGMSTAFYTSLAGMICSLFFTLIDKWIRICIQTNLHALTEKLDNTYYIDDVSVLAIEQNKMRNEFNSQLSYSTETGERIPICNAIREILAESSEQTKALKAFSTDLALELNNGFDEVLSRQMQQKILPLMENVDTTTKAIVEHIDQMAVKITSPASEMVQSVVGDLQNHLQSMVEDYKEGLTGSLTEHINILSDQLKLASETMSNIPANIESVSETLHNSVEEINNVIAEISKTSLNTNSSVMNQMQEFGDQMSSNVIQTIEKLDDYLNNTVSSMTESVQDAINIIINNINDRHVDLLALQDEITKQTKLLISDFSSGLGQLKTINEYITHTMDMFQKAQGQITDSTSNLESIASDMRKVSAELSTSQTEYLSNVKTVIEKTQENIENISDAISATSDLSDEYVDKFDLIKQGLGSIFVQLQNGLVEYSRTVQETTQKYLDQYSTSLTQTTDALSGTISQQSEVVEMLADIIEQGKK